MLPLTQISKLKFAIMVAISQKRKNAMNKCSTILYQHLACSVSLSQNTNISLKLFSILRFFMLTGVFFAVESLFVKYCLLRSGEIGPLRAFYSIGRMRESDSQQSGVVCVVSPCTQMQQRY